MRYNFKIHAYACFLLLFISTYSYAIDSVQTDSKLVNEITKNLYPAFNNGTVAKQSFDSMRLESLNKNTFNLKINYHHSKTSSNIYGTIIKFSNEEWFYGYCTNVYSRAKKYKNIIDDFSVTDLDTGEKLTIKMKDCILINDKKLSTKKSLNLFLSKIKHN